MDKHEIGEGGLSLASQFLCQGFQVEPLCSRLPPTSNGTSFLGYLEVPKTNDGKPPPGGSLEVCIAAEQP